MCLYAGDQLIHAEWLGHIVITAGAEALYPVGILNPCGQEDDRAMYVLPDSSSITSIFFIIMWLQYKSLFDI